MENEAACKRCKISDVLKKDEYVCRGEDRAYKRALRLSFTD